MSNPVAGNNQAARNIVPLGGEACEGRNAFRFVLDFSKGTTWLVDLTQFVQQDTIKSVQSLYVDNSAGTAALVFLFGGTQQTVTIPPGAQAYMPVLEANPPQFNVTCANAAQINIIQVLNFFVPPYMWGQTQALDIPAIDAIIVSGRMNVRTTPAPLTTLTDRSGTIAAGGTGQSLMAANAARTQWTLANPSTATEILQFSKIGATGPWYDLLPGASVQESGDTINTGQIWVKAATTAHAFTADEGTV